MLSCYVSLISKYFKNEELPKLSKEIRLVFDNYKKNLTKGSKRLIKDYCSNWKIKSSFKVRGVTSDEIFEYFSSKHEKN
jgi:hypothetical protein